MLPLHKNELNRITVKPQFKVDFRDRPKSILYQGSIYIYHIENINWEKQFAYPSISLYKETRKYCVLEIKSFTQARLLSVRHWHNYMFWFYN